jgi:hypothetical protein
MTLGTYTKPNVVGDVVLWEVGDGINYCRETKTVTTAANTTLEIGQVLEVGAATADYDILTTGTAIAVLLTRLVNDTAGALDKSGVVLLRGQAVLKKSGLSDVDAGTLTELAAVGFITRVGGNQG